MICCGPVFKCVGNGYLRYLRWCLGRVGVGRLTAKYVDLTLYLKTYQSGMTARPPVAGLVPRGAPPALALARRPTVVSPVNVTSVLITSAFLVLNGGKRRGVVRTCDLPRLQFLKSYRGVKKKPGRVTNPDNVSR